MRQRGPLLPIFDVPGRRGAVNFGAIVGETPPTPIAHFTYVPDELDFNFDASASTTPVGTITGYSWNFGDGDTSTTGPTVSHTYDAPGLYTVTLVVTNSVGVNSAPYSVDVVASPEWFVIRTLWDFPDDMPAGNHGSGGVGWDLDIDADGDVWAVHDTFGLFRFNEADPSTNRLYFPDIKGGAIVCIGDWLLISESTPTAGGFAYALIRRERADPADTAVDAFIPASGVLNQNMRALYHLGGDRVVFPARGRTIFATFAYLYEYVPSTETLDVIINGDNDRALAIAAEARESHTGDQIVVQWLTDDEQLVKGSSTSIDGLYDLDIDYFQFYPLAQFLSPDKFVFTNSSFSSFSIYDMSDDSTVPTTSVTVFARPLWHPGYLVTWYGTNPGNFPMTSVAVLGEPTDPVLGYATTGPPPTFEPLTSSVPGATFVSIERTTNYQWMFPYNGTEVTAPQFARWELIHKDDV